MKTDAEVDNFLKHGRILEINKALQGDLPVQNRGPVLHNTAAQVVQDFRSGLLSVRQALALLADVQKQERASRNANVDPDEGW